MLMEHGLDWPASTALVIPQRNPAGITAIHKWPKPKAPRPGGCRPGVAGLRHQDLESTGPHIRLKPGGYRPKALKDLEAPDPAH
jgi:hypothetical protein